MPAAVRLCLAAIAALPALPAAAHHSPAQFDLTQELTLTGVLSAVSWRNPHIYFELEIEGPDGRPVTQRIEAGPASNLGPQGFDAGSVAVGERVSVLARPNRAGPGRTVLGWVLTKADGTAIPLHVRAIPPTEPGSARATSLAGTWVPQGTGFSELAVAARSWPLTEAGRAAVEATREARNAARASCTPFGPPALMTLPSTVVVTVEPNRITLRFDVMGAERVIHLDQTEHPAALEPSLHGHSIGRFDGGTLVVDTIGYAPHPDGYAFDLPSSASKHLVERFTLTADGRQLEYEATVEDPEYFATPVTHRARWDYRPGQAPSNLPCETDVAAQFTEDD